MREKPYPFFRWQAALPFLLLVGLTFGLYAPSIRYPLVPMDDETYITNHSIVRNGLTAEGLRTAFSPDNRVAPMHMPLLWVSYMADTTFWGATPEHPAPFHFVNVLLHTFNALLVYALLLACSRKPLPALLGALLWALHPLRVESVAWVTERKDVLSGFFGLLSLWAWSRAHAAPEASAKAALPCHFGGVFSMLSLAAAIGAMLTKPSMVPLPLILLLMDIWPLRRVTFGQAGWRRRFLGLILEKTLYFAAAAWAAWQTLQGHEAFHSLTTLPWTLRLASVPVHYAFYLWKSLWPFRLSPLLPMITVSWLRLAVSLGFLGLLGAGAWRERVRHPQVAAGLAWFVLWLIPVIGWTGPMGVHSVADRFTYMAGIGLSLTLLEIFPRTPREKIRTGATVGGLIFYAILTAHLLPIWSGGGPLFARILAITPNHPAVLPITALDTLQATGDFATVRGQLEPLFLQAPDNTDLLSTLAICHYGEDGAAAARDWVEAHRPHDATRLSEWEFQMATYSFLAGRYADAQAFAASAQKKFPPEDLVQNNLRLLQMAAAFRAGDTETALAHARTLPPWKTAVRVTDADLYWLYADHWERGLRRDARAAFHDLLSRPDATPPDIQACIRDILANAAWGIEPAKGNSL